MPNSKMTPKQIEAAYKEIGDQIAALCAHDVNEAVQCVSLLATQTVRRITGNQGQDITGISITITPDKESENNRSITINAPKKQKANK